MQEENGRPDPGKGMIKAGFGKEDSRIPEKGFHYGD
jgi:hypothetical protein